MRRFFAGLYRWIMGYDSGCVHLQYGNHIIYVPTQIRPSEVWVKLIGRGTDGCCQIPMNEIGYILKNKGIIFNVEVRTDCCVVEWFATR
jgi:hypothetical protein